MSATPPRIIVRAMMLLTMILGGVALMMMRRRKQGVALLLALALALPAANLLAAARERPAKKPATEAATTLVKAEAKAAVEKGPKTVTLALADGSKVVVGAGDIEIKDKRSAAGVKKPRRELSKNALWNGDLPESQPIVVRVKYGEDGAVKKVRVDVYSTLDEATKVVAERTAKKAEHQAKQAAEPE